MNDASLPISFLQYATDILGDTNAGLTGNEIVKACNAYAIDFSVDTPITTADFGSFGSLIPNKRTALLKNLQAFNAVQQYVIITELCGHPKLSGYDAASQLLEKTKKRFCCYAADDYLPKEKKLTGWQRVDRTLEEMRERTATATAEEHFQTVGMLGRECLITIAQMVYKPYMTSSETDFSISNTDAKRMFEAFLDYRLRDEDGRVKKCCKATFDLANHVTHKRNATMLHAKLCLSMVMCVAGTIKAFDEFDSDDI